MKSVLGIFAAVLLTANMLGQVTQKLSDEAVISDGNNPVVSSSLFSMSVSMLQGSETVTPLYVKTHTSASSVNCLVPFEFVDGIPLTERFADDVWSTHYIGESYGGGIVFHVDNDGQHGLITATVDESTIVQKQEGIDLGKFVAVRIIALEGEVAYDAQILTNDQDSNYDDWYLPTNYDLNLLYRNRSAIGGFSDFARGWSSTAATSSVNAWFQSFTTGARFTNGKDDGVYVRVLRKF